MITHVPQQADNGWALARLLSLQRHLAPESSLQRHARASLLPLCRVRSFPESGITPPTVIVYDGLSMIVAVGGCPSAEAVARLLGGYREPSRMRDDFGVNRTIAAAAVRVVQEMTEVGVDLVTDMYFTGHSFGGAIVAAIAERIKALKPDMRTSVCTFGAPRVGEQRFVTNYGNIPTCRWMNNGDPIPILPPHAGEIHWSENVLTRATALGWLNWYHAGLGVMMSENNYWVTEDADVYLENSTLDAFLGWATGLLGAPVLQHAIATYEARLYWIQLLTTPTPIVEQPRQLLGTSSINMQPRLPLQLIQAIDISPTPWLPTPTAPVQAPVGDLPGNMAYYSNYNHKLPPGPYYHIKLGTKWMVACEGQYLWTCRGNREARKHAARLNSAVRSWLRSPARDNVAFNEAALNNFPP